MAEPSVDEPLSMGVLCFIASRAVEFAVIGDIQAAGYDVTLAQGRLVARIGRDGTRIGELAEAAGVTKQTATALVDAVERAGLVERVPDPLDARARLVVVSDKGREAVEVARRAEERVYAEWRAAVGSRRWAQLREALELIREVADPWR